VNIKEKVIKSQKFMCHNLQGWIRRHAIREAVPRLQKHREHPKIHPTRTSTVANITEDFICKVAKTLKEAAELIEVRFKYVTDMDKCKLFRKKKTTLELASAESSASLV